LALTYRDTLGLIATDKAERAQQAAQAWQDRLATLPGAPVLPEQLNADPQAPTPQVTRHHIWLPPARKQALAERARGQGVTVAMTVAALLAEVIGHWSDSDHFLLNVPMFDRPASHPDIDRVVGDFSSSVMLEVDLRQPQTFAQRVRALQERMHRDAAHAAYTGLDVLRDLSRQRGETVLAPVVFTSALGLGELFPPEVTALVGRPVWVISQGPQVLLDAQVTEFDGGLLVNWDTRQDALLPGLVDAMFSLFANSLDQIIDQPESWDQMLDLCPQDPLRQTADGQPVRVLDRLGRNRPDHVAGRLQGPSDGTQASTLWGRAEGDGRVTILGEDSQQALVNGIPVLPQQVYEAVCADPRISEAAILPCKGGFMAAVVFAPSADPLTGKALRAHLAQRLPAHILPAQVTVLDQLPRDAAGAVDHPALAQQVAAEAGPAAFVAPTCDLEQVIADVWAEVLGLDQVSIADEFIALGGDSLLAARVVARLQEDLDSPAITLRALFRSPTVADLAAHLRQEDDPARLDEVAAIIIEIGQMSDDEVAALLDQPPSREEVPA
jgi:acyl carrier protein